MKQANRQYKKKMTEEKVKEMINEYENGIKIRFLVEKYGLAKSSIKRWLKIFKIPPQDRREYSINDNYFQTVDTEERAYILGFLYADGCNHFNRNRFGISLQEKDRYILEEFKKQMDATYLVKKCSSRKNYKDKWNIQSKQQMYSFICTSQKICEDLSKLGCVPRKTTILKFPTEDQVPPHLIRHFIRGYFDGDGSITTYLNQGKYFKCCMGFTSTLPFLIKLKEVLAKNCNVNLIIQKDVRFYSKNNETQSSAFNSKITGRLQGIKLKEYLYNDCSIFLTRKKDKFDSLESVPFIGGYTFACKENDNIYYFNDMKEISVFIHKTLLTTKAMILFKGGEEMSINIDGRRLLFKRIRRIDYIQKGIRFEFD